MIAIFIHKIPLLVYDLLASYVYLIGIPTIFRATFIFGMASPPQKTVLLFLCLLRG